MKLFLRVISNCAIVLMFVAAFLCFADKISVHNYRILALSGTFIWFATVPFWMHRRLHNPPD